MDGLDSRGQVGVVEVHLMFLQLVSLSLSFPPSFPLSLFLVLAVCTQVYILPSHNSGCFLSEKVLGFRGVLQAFPMRLSGVLWFVSIAPRKDYLRQGVRPVYNHSQEPSIHRRRDRKPIVVLWLCF